VIGALAGAVAGHKLQDGVSDWKDNRHEEKEKEKREEEERKRREEDERRRREEQQHRPHHDNNNNNHHHDRGVHYAGNFSGSSQDIRLDAHGEYMLHASCKRLDGSYQSSSISLNRLIENDQGSFRWASAGGGGRRNDSNKQTSVTVQPGDTLRNIAARFGCSFEEIARLNGLANPDLIHPGTVLQIPNSGGGGGGGHGSGGEGNFGASARDVRLADGGRRLEGELLRDGRWVGSSIMLDEKVGNDNGTLTFVN
jgi:LysM repeat protein